jgi:hypothetical protein
MSISVWIGAGIVGVGALAALLIPSQRPHAKVEALVPELEAAA